VAVQVVLLVLTMEALEQRALLAVCCLPLVAVLENIVKPTKLVEQAESQAVAVVEVVLKLQTPPLQQTHQLLTAISELMVMEQAEAVVAEQA